MDTPKMHVMFRQYAQQMGMQNVRAILPEQIDLLLNTSQMDMVNQIIKENVGITNDRVITDNSKIGQVNALRTLYHVSILSLANVNTSSKAAFEFYASDRYSGRMTSGFIKPNDNIPSYMFLVDFSINYRKVKNKQGYTGVPNDNSIVAFDSDSFVTNYFPVRLIDDSYLADTLNDFILKPRLRSPIMVTYRNNEDDEFFDLYIDKFTKTTDNRYVLTNDLIPYQLRMSYISTPKDIEFNEDKGGSNVDCELPDYMHVDLVKHAVDLYRVAIQGSMMGAQQQEQNAQRENLRNNYRNEGNAQQQ